MGTASKIDHIAIPTGALDMVERCTTLRGKGKRLQTIRCKGLRDHLPVALVINIGEISKFRTPEKAKKPDRDALSWAVYARA